jgi:hypothetical protein
MLFHGVVDRLLVVDFVRHELSDGPVTLAQQVHNLAGILMMILSDCGGQNPSIFVRAKVQLLSAFPNSSKPC